MKKELTEGDSLEVSSHTPMSNPHILPLRNAKLTFSNLMNTPFKSFCIFFRTNYISKLNQKVKFNFFLKISLCNCGGKVNGRIAIHFILLLHFMLFDERLFVFRNHSTISSRYSPMFSCSTHSKALF